MTYLVKKAIQISAIEHETEFENILACLSGAQMGSNHAKNGGRKSRDTLPLIVVNYLDAFFGQLFLMFSLNKLAGLKFIFSVITNCTTVQGIEE